MMAVTLYGEVLTLPLFASLLAMIAAFLLMVMAVLRRPAKAAKAPVHAPGTRAKASLHVVVDGSNVMHWNGKQPQIATVREVIAALRAKGYQPGVIFDANAGYKIGDRYLDDQDFAKLLNLPSARVLVVNKGEPADPTILAAARELGARVVTNDRFRDWAGDFPEVANKGHLLKGGYRKGTLWLDEAA